MQLGWADHKPSHHRCGWVHDSGLANDCIPTPRLQVLFKYRQYIYLMSTNPRTSAGTLEKKELF